MGLGPHYESCFSRQTSWTLGMPLKTQGYDVGLMVAKMGV